MDWLKCESPGCSRYLGLYSQGKGAIGNRPWWKVGASLAPLGNERDLLELSLVSEGFKGVDQSPSEWDASMALRWLKKQSNGVALQLKGQVGRSVQPFTGRERSLGTMRLRLQGAVGRRRNEHQANGRAEEGVLKRMVQCRKIRLEPICGCRQSLG